MGCRHCGAENSDQARFCQACGGSLAPEPKSCASRGTVNSETAKFCVNCGNALETSGKPADVGASAHPSISLDTKTVARPTPNYQAIRDESSLSAEKNPLARPTVIETSPPSPSTGGHKVAALSIWAISAILFGIAIFCFESS